VPVEARHRCQPACLARGEPKFGTASTVQRWLLIEQSGPWGETALRQSRIAIAVAERIIALARTLGARPVLIRRPRRALQLGCQVYVGSAGARTVWLEHFELARVEDLLEIDLAPLKRGASVGGERVKRPLFLVCTHGKHDACCAQFGRPVASALAAEDVEHVWECSHIGGDRFAGNLLCFPHGLYFGHVTPASASRIASLYRASRIDLEHYRGRCAYPFSVQAADWFLRRELGIDTIDGVELIAYEAASDRVQAFLATERARYLVTVAIGRDAEPLRLTCRSASPERAPRYELVSIEPQVSLSGS
jgi:hypothetical protein